MFRRIWRVSTRVVDRFARFVGGILIILFMLAWLDIGWGHLHYLLQDGPKQFTQVSEALHLRTDDAFHGRLPLDWGSAVHHRDNRHEYTLVPVRGTGGRLFVILPGKVGPVALGDAPELEGRAIGKGWMGDWDAGEIDTEVRLQDEFSGTDVYIAPDALLLVPGWRFTVDEYWQILLGVVALAILPFWLARWVVGRKQGKRI